ncbi:MAG TPA: TIGR01777 family oxidoreductase, partial [Nevskiaceae bacterium]|nr:TIGR01777 family oxidoreductase [Nevskiaceae bacterium]
PGHEFQSDLCREWERAANEADALGIRVCCMRFGIVLGRDGGALARLLPAFRFGLGGPMGNGAQWMSWIHRDDLVGAIQWALARAGASGAYNTTSPAPVTNREFARALGAVMHRPARIKTPALALQLLFGEMSRLLLGGQKVLPTRLQESGFIFRQPDLRGALEHLLS